MGEWMVCVCLCAHVYMGRCTRVNICGDETLMSSSLSVLFSQARTLMELGAHLMARWANQQTLGPSCLCPLPVLGLQVHVITLSFSLGSGY